jgi:hypothetical protein
MLATVSPSPRIQSLITINVGAVYEEKSNLEKKSQPVAAGFLYPLTLAFPSWAGAVLAVYSIFLCRFSALKLRLK